MEEKEVKGCCCCSGRIKKRTEEDQKALLNRLSRLEGQIRGIRRMIEEDAYCTDVLMQSAAVTSAMNAFNRELLADHIRSCVTEDIRAGKDETVDELVGLIQRMMK